LLVHGIMSNGERDWPRARWIEPIAAQGRNVFVIDLPGHGVSRRVDRADDARTSSIVDALAAVVAEASTPVDVIAYSLGARLSWSLAVRYPDRVNRLVLGGLVPGEPFSRFDFVAARRFADTGEKPDDPMTGFLAGMFASSGDAHSLINLAEGLAGEPFEPKREAPSGPTLFIAGSDDQMTAGIDALVPLIPGSRLLRVPGDHLGALASDAFRGAAFDFLDLTL
jgi:pimeloyl-ACP methyl ester carboxylesterase